MRGLAVIVGVSGLLVVVACSSPYGAGAGTDQAASTGGPSTTGTTQTEPKPTPTPMPTPTQAPLPGRDAGPPGSGSSSGDAAATDPALCPSTESPTLTPWKTPPAASAACTSADIAYFASVAANQTWLGIESLMRTRNASCAKCIFSKEADAQWRPVVYIGASGDAIVNYAACFARAAGGNEACGREVHEWGDCYAKVCDATACGTDAAIDACYGTKTVSDLCDGHNPTTACGGAAKYASLDNVCGTYIEVARTLCAAN